MLKLYQTSRVLYLHAVHLADVVTHIDGSVFFHTQWYQLAKRGIDEDNARNDAYDSVKVAEEREPTLLKLRPHLEAIDKAVKAFNGRDYSAHSLLVHLHSAHRPKRVNEPVVFYGAALDRDNSEAVKKALLRAVGYYHPDRGYNKSAGIEWFILCGEITKTLNEAYTRYKV